nr:hypothetical protein [Methylobacterium sp. ZNC0032]
MIAFKSVQPPELTIVKQYYYINQSIQINTFRMQEDLNPEFFSCCRVSSDRRGDAALAEGRCHNRARHLLLPAVP